MTQARFREMYFDESLPVYADGMLFRNHVEMNDFGVGPENRCSTNYCNCVALGAVGLHDGLLGHFEGISEPGERQDRFYEAIAGLQQVKPELIVLAGGRLEDDDLSRQLAVADRAFAARALEEYVQSDPAPTLITHWNDGDAEAVNMHINPAYAQITVVNVSSIPYSGYPGINEY